MASSEEPKGLGRLLLQIVPLLVCHWYGCARFSFEKFFHLIFIFITIGDVVRIRSFSYVFVLLMIY